MTLPPPSSNSHNSHQRDYAQNHHLNVHFVERKRPRENTNSHTSLDLTHF